MIYLGTQKVKTKKHKKKYEPFNNLCMIVSFFITVLNIFITVFNSD